MTDAEPPITDAELLRIVGDERKRSIGFEHDDILLKEREKALEYYKGELRDVPALANRSKAVSTDIADAIETLMADLVPIFTEGDDVMEFVARGPQDEDQAKLESDYVSWVVFQQNPGFLILSTFFKDALQVKTGVVKWWWEDAPKAKPEIRKGVPLIQAAVARATGQAIDAQPSEPTDDSGETQSDALFDLTLPPQPTFGRVRIEAWPPEDFTVASDTVWLPDATYIAARSRPRAQELVKQGIDPKLVERLPGWSAQTQQIQQARDTAGEFLSSYGSPSNAGLRQVEVVEHYIRLVRDGEPVLYRVLTGENESVLLEREEIDHLPFAAITPYLVTHRFYGESVADKLMEIVRIKTALTRGGLDSIYFALNQRMGVATQGANEFTITDLLDNRPGMPVRMDREGAVFPLASGGMEFDRFAQGLEYFSTVGEQRTGIVRNAQGLNPDTLHDTAAGAAMLNAAANKRTRFIARVFGETGLKDLFLGVHRLLKQKATSVPPVKIRGEWQTPSPVEWASRHDVTVDVGVGAGDRMQTIASLGQVLDIQEKVVEAQGGYNGPLVTAQNVYAVATDLVSKQGSKKGPQYFTDPSKAPTQPPQPNAELVKAQGEQQAKQGELALKGQQQQADVAQGQAEQALDARRLALEEQQHADKVALEHRKLDLAFHTARLGDETRRQDTETRAAVQREGIHVGAASKAHAVETQAATTLQVEAMHDATAREVQASEAEDARVMDD